MSQLELFDSGQLSVVDGVPEHLEVDWNNMKSVLKNKLTCKFDDDVAVYLYLPRVQVDIHDSSDKRTDSVVELL